MITKKTWVEFRNMGLLLFINQILHVFGWAIVFEFENDEVVNVYPACVEFRGFDNASVSESYKNITGFLKENIDELKEEADS